MPSKLGTRNLCDSCEGSLPALCPPLASCSPPLLSFSCSCLLVCVSLWSLGSLSGRFPRSGPGRVMKAVLPSGGGTAKFPVRHDTRQQSCFPVGAGSVPCPVRPHLSATCCAEAQERLGSVRPCRSRGRIGFVAGGEGQGNAVLLEDSWLKKGGYSVVYYF